MQLSCDKVDTCYKNAATVRSTSCTIMPRDMKPILAKIVVDNFSLLVTGGVVPAYVLQI